MIKQKIPTEIFMLLMQPFSTGELKDLEWKEDGELEPTNITDGQVQYHYALSKPEHLNKFWEMEKWDVEYDGVPWKRGYKAQRVHLSQSAAQRGHTASSVSSVSGVATVQFNVPKDEALWPELRITFSVLTRNEHNSILWNKDSGPKTKAAMRKMTQAGLEKMAADPLFPLAGELKQSFELTPTDTVLQVPSMMALTMSTATAADEQ